MSNSFSPNLRFRDIASPSQYEDYYRQHLGERGQFPPGVELTPEAITQFEAEGGLLWRLDRALPVARGTQFRILDCRVLTGTFCLYLSLDEPSAASEVLEWMRREAGNELEVSLYESVLKTHYHLIELVAAAKKPGQRP